MKKIKFHELSFTRNPFAATLMVCAALFTILSLFNLFDFLGEFNVKWITAACYLIFAYQVGARQFFYRHHVEWNKRGINICINNFWGLSFSFSDVKKVIFAEDNYTLQMYGGATKNIDLSGIEQNSKERLLQLLQANIS